jgi:hypothetical protein
MEIKKIKQKVKRIKREKSELEKGVNTLQFCGLLKLKESPLAIQKKLRDDWQ